MLNTATPVSAYQLSRMLRDSPLTSKYTSPSRGNGAASAADMLPMVTLDPRLCPVGGHLTATGNTALAVGPARFSRLAAERSWRMAQLSVGSAGPAGFPGMAGAQPAPPVRCPDWPDLPCAPRCGRIRKPRSPRAAWCVGWIDGA